jgi:hypothetical protein
MLEGHAVVFGTIFFALSSFSPSPNFPSKQEVFAFLTSATYALTTEGAIPFSLSHLMEQKENLPSDFLPILIG